MKQLLDLRGIVTVLNTPFTDADEIDVTGLARNVEAAIEAGVVGLLAPAMASEVSKLTESERELMVRVVLDTVQGRAAVIGGASAPTREERVRISEKLTQMGCDGVLVSIAYENEANYEAEVRAVADTQPGFLMVQDWDETGSGVPVPVIARLFNEIDVFRCLKVETVPAGVKYSAVLAATEGRLHVSGGWAVTQMIEGLDRGVHAFMPTGMHRIYTSLYRMYVQGDREGAQRLFNEMVPAEAFSSQHLDISIHFFKRLLHRQGICATPRVRQPILPFDAYHERIAAEQIERLLGIERRLA
ncbi:MAG: dihydrodipicolinate synthase family protein [Candidatus Hydrogenedentes bacterium]|nr:dihydrodipicolinate synthase family protein [Candidatus Hydrogenedentota bacterium]